MNPLDHDQIYFIENISMEYDNRQVLRIESLSVYQGEILALVGPSGAGKSTLLRVLNFLEAPSTGRVNFRSFVFQPGEVVPLEARRKVTTVFQHPILLDRSVWDNIAVGLRLRGLKDRAALIEAAIIKVGLEDLARQNARTLSGGEAQRVALARALVIEPEVLLLDEPTANLDPYNINLIEKIIQETIRKTGMTIVLVTHNIFQARRLADRVAFLLGGELIELSNTDSFFENPKDPRTAAFVHGDMVY
jgi:tungstate transport system ATP-binding protein